MKIPSNPELSPVRVQLLHNASEKFATKDAPNIPHEIGQNKTS